MLKQLFDVKEAVEEAVNSMEVREVASLIYNQHDVLSDDEMKRALYGFAGRVASVTAFEVFRRFLSEEELQVAIDTIDELLDIAESAEEGSE